MHALYITVISTDPDTGEMDRKRRLDSDSDSDLSAMGNPDLDLASSHSSDDDDDDDNFAWDSVNPQPQQSEYHETGHYVMLVGVSMKGWGRPCIWCFEIEL